MGCFLFACFTAPNHKKCKHLVNATPSKPNQDGATEASKVNEPTNEEEVARVPIKPILESKEKLEEQLSCNEKKKVTFDLNVKTHEGLSIEEEVANNLLVEKNEDKKECVKNEEEESNVSKSVSNVVTSNVGSYPPNSRYQNCVTEEEYDDLDLEDSDLNDAVQELIQEESSESLFSLSIDSRRQVVYEAELGEKEVTSPMPKCGSSPKEEAKVMGSYRNAGVIRSQCNDSVLNPVENLTQWKVAKARAMSPLQHEEDKENVNVEQGVEKNIISPETNFKIYMKDSKENPNKKKLVDLEIAVDTSLSSWLATPPMSKGSANSVGNSPSAASRSTPTSHEDRPILGALTMEELKQHSASNTPRRSRSKSPDEAPIIGTVGSYWICTGGVVDSDSGSSSKGTLKTKKIEDEKVKWNSIPFEERLERALEGGIAQV